MNQNSFLLQQIRVIDPASHRDFIADILVIDGHLAKIATEPQDYDADLQVIAGDRLILGSGLVDLYSHSGEPGHESRETLLSLAQSARAGGFTQVGILPDTNPVIDNWETLSAIATKYTHLKRTHRGLPEFNFWANLALEDSSNMAELGELSDLALGFSQKLDFSQLAFFKQALEYLQPLNKAVAIDLSQNQLTKNGIVRESKDSINYGVVGNPGYSEAAAIAAVLEIIAEVPTPVHLMRVSTARGVALIADAKQRGVPVTASTTWMHLLFDTSDQASYDSNLRLEPPLGTPSDCQALQQGVKTGTIDAIAIDHQAYTYEEKTVPFALAPPGVIGLQLALPILWQKLVTTDVLTPLELWQALSSHPLNCLGKSTEEIKPGIAISSLTLFDPEQTWQVNQQTIHSLSANTPWWHQEIRGKVIFNYS